MFIHTATNLTATGISSGNATPIPTSPDNTPINHTPIKNPTPIADLNPHNVSNTTISQLSTNPNIPTTPEQVSPLSAATSPTDNNGNHSNNPSTKSKTSSKFKYEHKSTDSQITIVERESIRSEKSPFENTPNPPTVIVASTTQKTNNHNIKTNDKKLLNIVVSDKGSPSDKTSDSGDSPNFTPVPSSTAPIEDNNNNNKTMILKQPNDNPFSVIGNIDEKDMVFDEEEDLNTPIEDVEQVVMDKNLLSEPPEDEDQEDDIDKNEQEEEEQQQAPDQSPIETDNTSPIQDSYDVDDFDDDIFNGEYNFASSEFNIWGSSPEEEEAFKYITHSCPANLCKHIYRCCPLYRMKIGFCIKMSCELCHTLCIFFSIFFFILVIVFITCNPIIFVSTDNQPYITETFTNVQANSHGYNDGDDIVIDQTEQTKAILTDIINYEQTFTYSMDEATYFRPKDLQQLKYIIRLNKNDSKSNTIRVMGAGKTSNYVYTDKKNGILLDMKDFPSNPQIEVISPFSAFLNTEETQCIADDCVGIVTVNASMKIRDLNEYLLNEGGYVVRGFSSTDDITIGGALGSCSVGPLYDGKPLGYYLVMVKIIDANGDLRTFGIDDEINCVKYLDAIRCNLGVLGVIYQVKLEIFQASFVHREQYFIENYNLDEISFADNRFNDTEGFNNTIGKELFLDPYTNDLLWIVWSDKMEINSAEIVEEMKEYTVPSYNVERDVLNTLITPISCVFADIFDGAIDHFMRNGRYFYNQQSYSSQNDTELSPLPYSIRIPEYFLATSQFIIPQNRCIEAIINARDLANELYDNTRMLPIGIIYILMVMMIDDHY